VPVQGCTLPLQHLVVAVCESDSPTTTEGHRLFATTRCCNYSLFELLMMGECFIRNMYSRLQGIKYCTKKCHFIGTFLKNELKLIVSTVYINIKKSHRKVLHSLLFERKVSIIHGKKFTLLSKRTTRFVAKLVGQGICANC
jgi:hypothetical protein